ncbi:MAG: methyltransferase regulatory domain-containing protein [Gemmataceae bacterium]
MGKEVGPQTTYDDVPYPSHPYVQTHPDHLATIATLLGLTPPPVEKCRALEIGCASGGNLIPLALTLPKGQFLGIDLSSKQIAEGQQDIDALGLQNIELRHLSITDIDESFGTFDYILCHGVYSWVPREVQQKILDVCSKNLEPNGIAYISYNTHPGWYLRGMIRDMARYHVNRFPGESPEQKIYRARSLLDFLVTANPSGTSPYTLLLKENVELLRQHSDAYLFHEHLEETNEPVYFLQFCERLAQHQLRYLGEAEFRIMVSSTGFSAEAQRRLEELAPNLLEKEQYMDFLRNRSFRQSLVCHVDQQPDYNVRAESIAHFSIASPARPTSEGFDIHSATSTEFTAGSVTLTTTTPIVKAALLHLGKVWPKAIPFQTLLHQARLHLAPSATEDPTSIHRLALILSRALLTAYCSGDGSLVELSLHPPTFSTEVTDRPVASPLVRLQATRDNWVTSLRHEKVPLSPFDCHMLPLLDGSRDRETVLEALVNKFQDGILSISEDEKPINNVDQGKAILGEVLDQQLPHYARVALLVG